MPRTLAKISRPRGEKRTARGECIGECNAGACGFVRAEEQERERGRGEREREKERGAEK